MTLAHAPGRVWRWMLDADIVIVVRILGIVVAASILMSSYAIWHQSADTRENAQRQCEQGNRSRYGGEDYLRPVIRALVQKDPLFVRKALIEQGFSPALAQVNDVARIDCATGKPQPLPKGAVK